MTSKAVRGETPVLNCFSLKMTCIISAHSPLAKTSHMTLVKLQGILGNVENTWDMWGTTVCSYSGAAPYTGLGF